MKRIVTLLLIATGWLGAQQKMDLDACLKVAFENNYNLAIAQKQEDAARKGVLASYSGILPQIGFGSTAQRTTQGPNEYVAYGTTFITSDTTQYYYAAGVSYNQNIFDGGKWWNNIRLAKSNAEGAGIDRKRGHQLVIVTVTEKFYNVLKAQELLKVYQKSLENSREQLNKTSEMHRIGQVAKKDLFKAQVREGNDRLSVIQQQQAVESAVAELNLAMGISPQTAIEVYEEQYTAPEDIAGEKALASALKENTEYNSLLASKQSTLLQYKIAKGDWFPNVSTSYTYYRGGRNFEKTYQEFDKWWNTQLTLRVNVPLFNGFSRKIRVQQRYLDYKITEDRIAQKKIDIQNQVENLILMLNTYREMIEINELNIVSAKEDMRLAQEMYRLNSATLLEVLDAQVALTRAEGNLITTKYNAKIAEAQLQYVMGML